MVYDYSDLEKPTVNAQYDYSDLEKPVVQEKQMGLTKSIPRSLLAGATATGINTLHDIANVGAFVGKHLINPLVPEIIPDQQQFMANALEGASNIIPHVERGEMLNKFGVKNPSGLDEIAYYAPEIAMIPKLGYDIGAAGVRGASKLIGKSARNALKDKLAEETANIGEQLKPSNINSHPDIVNAQKSLDTIRSLMNNPESSENIANINKHIERAKTLKQVLSGEADNSALQVANNISNGLSPGENASAIARKIHEGFPTIKNNMEERFNEIENDIGHGAIKSQRTMEAITDPEGDASDYIFRNKNLKKVTRDYANNPTYSNLRRLKSDFAKEAYSIPYAAGETSSNVKNIKNALLDISKKADLDSRDFVKDYDMFLSNNEGQPVYGKRYLPLLDKANDYYAKEYLPYLRNRQLNKIVSGDLLDFNGNFNEAGLDPVISSIMKSPEATLLKSHFGDDLSRQFLYHELSKGGAFTNPSAKKITGALNKIEPKKLGDFVSDDIGDLRKSLNSKQSRVQKVNDILENLKNSKSSALSEQKKGLRLSHEKAKDYLNETKSYIKDELNSKRQNTEKMLKDIIERENNKKKIAKVVGGLVLGRHLPILKHLL